MDEGFHQTDKDDKNHDREDDLYAQAWRSGYWLGLFLLRQRRDPKQLDTDDFDGIMMKCRDAQA
jgi:hypothetical protein